MSLVRLLTTGKSLVGLHDSESRYRVNSKRLLPKFNEQNPFGGAGAPAGPSSPPTACAHAQPADTDAQTAMAEKLETENVKATKPVRQRGLVARWVDKLWGLFQRKPAAPRAAIPRFDKVPVQGELSLDRIRVMRNDLSDSDLEVVPVGTTSSKVRPARSVAKKPAPEAAEPVPETVKLI